MDRPSHRAHVVAAYADGPEGGVGLVERLAAGCAEPLERVVARVAVLEGANAALRRETRRCVVGSRRTATPAASRPRRMGRGRRSG